LFWKLPSDKQTAQYAYTGVDLQQRRGFGSTVARGPGHMHEEKTIQKPMEWWQD
jgi:hypothetical protein